MSSGKFPKRLFQEGAYKGEERRTSPGGRVELSSETQHLLNILRKGFDCQESCFLSKKSQSVVNHGIGALGEIGEIGDDKPSTGIDNMRDQYKRVKTGFSLWDMVKKRALLTVVVAVVLGGLSLLALGFFERLKGV